MDSESFWTSLQNPKHFFTVHLKNISKKVIKTTKLNKWDIFLFFKSETNKKSIISKAKTCKPNQRRVPIFSIVSKWKIEKRNSMYQSGVRHLSKMNACSHMGQLLTVGASSSARILAHEVQNAYPLPRKVTTASDENVCVCWCCHDKLDGNDSLDVLAFRSQAWKASFTCRAYIQFCSIGARAFQKAPRKLRLLQR